MSTDGCGGGNLFRPVAFFPESRTSTDLVLQDANCTDEAILMHYRGPESHVRGCWIENLMLGKE